MVERAYRRLMRDILNYSDRSVAPDRLTCNDRPATALSSINISDSYTYLAISTSTQRTPVSTLHKTNVRDARYCTPTFDRLIYHTEGTSFLAIIYAYRILGPRGLSKRTVEAPICKGLSGARSAVFYRYAICCERNRETRGPPRHVSAESCNSFGSCMIIACRAPSRRDE